MLPSSQADLDVGGAGSADLSMLFVTSSQHESRFRCFMIERQPNANMMLTGTETMDGQTPRSLVLHETGLQLWKVFTCSAPELGMLVLSQLFTHRSSSEEAPTTKT
jgi:hypothetical protein